MLSRKWTGRLLLAAAFSFFAVSLPSGCKSLESKPASKSCGDPTCDTKH